MRFTRLLAWLLLICLIVPTAACVRVCEEGLPSLAGWNDEPPDSPVFRDHDGRRCVDVGPLEILGAVDNVYRNR